MNFFPEDLIKTSAFGNPMDSFHHLDVALKNRSKVKKWSKNIMSGFWKSGSNLSCDLLIFDPGPIAHLYPKKTPNKANSNYIFHWKLQGNMVFWFRSTSRGALGSELDQKLKFWVHPASLKIRDFPNAVQNFPNLYNTTCVQNFSSTWHCLLELLPQNSRK